MNSFSLEHTIILADLDAAKPNPISSASLDDTLLSNSSPRQTGKISRPLSYSPRLDNQRSTRTVVKELIGGGATLVYDSLAPNKPSPAPAPAPVSSLQHQFYPNHQYQQQRKEHVRIEQATHRLHRNLTVNITTTTAPPHDATNQNRLTLTGRQLPANPPHNIKSTNTKPPHVSAQLISLLFSATETLPVQ
jgi:hypothetical protein